MPYTNLKKLFHKIILFFLFSLLMYNARRNGGDVVSSEMILFIFLGGHFKLSIYLKFN